MSANSSQAVRKWFYFATFQPITLGSGTWYRSCTGEDLLAYTNPIPGPRPSKSKADSTRELTNFLTNQWPNARARRALYRIKQVIDTPDWGPDTLIKMLPDMDVAFFNGQLRSRVRVSWHSGRPIQFLGTPITRFAKALAVTAFDEGNNICYIYLNRDKICSHPSGPRMVMLGTLIHEMIVSINSTLPPSHPKFCLRVA